MKTKRLLGPFIAGISFLCFLTTMDRAAQAKFVHAEVLVFVPAYEGSQLFDQTLDKNQSDPACVWGNYNTFLSSKRYFSLRMPNPLVARPMMSVGPVDVYQGFVAQMTKAQEKLSTFAPYTLGADFFHLLL